MWELLLMCSYLFSLQIVRAAQSHRHPVGIQAPPVTKVVCVARSWHDVRGHSRTTSWRRFPKYGHQLVRWQGEIEVFYSEYPWNQCWFSSWIRSSLYDHSRLTFTRKKWLVVCVCKSCDWQMIRQSCVRALTLRLLLYQPHIMFKQNSRKVR